MTDAELQSKLAERDDVIRQLVARLRETVDENDRLRGELARQAEDTSAYDVLVDIMRNSDLPAAIRTKAASAVLPHQKPKLMPERAPLEGNVVPSPPIPGLVHQQRARMNRLHALSIEARGDLINGVVRDDGNGADDSDDAPFG